MIKIQNNPVIPKDWRPNNAEKIAEWMNKLPVVKNYTKAIEADKKWNNLKTWKENEETQAI